MEENDKILRLDRSKRESAKKFEKAFEIVKNTWGEDFHITQLSNFDRSKLGFDQSKNRFDWLSTNWARQIKTKFLIAFSISQKTASIDWKSESLKILKNKGSFMQKPLKPLYFMNEMHEYEFKSFAKKLEFNPDLPKTRFSHFCPQNSNNKHILYQNQWTYNLGWPNQLHTQFHVLSLAKNNLCNVCN